MPGKQVQGEIENYYWFKTQRKGNKIVFFKLMFLLISHLFILCVWACKCVYAHAKIHWRLEDKL